MDLLASQLVQVLQFISSNFKTDMVFTDHILSEVAVGHDLFYQNGNLWFMRNESIPGETSLKAIGFDKTAVYLETGEIDFDQAQRIIDSDNLDCVIDETRRQFVNGNGRVLLEYSKPEVLKFEEEELEPRIQIKIPLADMRLKGITLVDKLWSFNAFKTAADEDQAGPQTYGTRRLELRLNLSLQNRLALEQRPMLLLNQKIKIETRLELKGIFSLQHRLFSMTGKELEEYVTELAAKEGIKRVQSTLDFALAGRIKKTRPQLSWVQARTLARRIASRV